MTDDQIAQLAKVSEGMAHILKALDDIKAGMGEIRREFVSRTHYDGEITALKLRLQALEEAAKKSAFDSVVKFFGAVATIGAGGTAVVLLSQWLARHA